MVISRNKILLFSLLVFVACNMVAQEDYRSGEIRLEFIMLNAETGMGMTKHVNPDPAESLNLLSDLCYRELISAIPCRTVVGPIFIEEKLKAPFRAKDLSSLQQVQDAIRTLVDTPGLKARIDELLVQAKQYEKEVAQFFSEEFKTERCPELAQLSLLKKEDSFQYPLRKWLNVDPLGRTISTPFSLVGAGIQARAAQGGFGATQKSFSDIWSAKDKFEAGEAFVACGYQGSFSTFTGMAAIFGVYSVYRDCINAAEKRLKMHAFCKLIEIAKELETLSRQHGITLQFKLSDIQDPKGLELISALQGDRYKDAEQPTFFMMPLVHTLAYALYVHDKQFAPLFASIGEMDTYNAFATNIVNSYEKNNKFCFVQFIESDRSQINARSFWSVLVKNPVSNTLCEARHVLLTGPNAGGKSTTIRAILQNILFAQCFGVAAAQEFDYTMFDVIHSYLNISDNVLNGESRFKAEINRAASIFKKIESLKSDQKYFFALDELFTGTSVEQGEKCAYAFISRVTKRPNVQCIYATHFEKLKQMGNDSASGVVNYKVDDPTKNAVGNLVYPFTISPGASSINIALDMAREAGLLDEEFTAAG